MGGKVALARGHLVDPSSDEFAKAHEGVRVDRRRVEIIRGCRGRGPVREEELLGPQFESEV